MFLTRFAFILFTIMLYSSGSIAQESYWQQRVDYNINFILNDRDHELDGNLTVKYRNNSPDTLAFIWFHIWPNAFKNDRTAFSEQHLQNGKTDFYFARTQDRGYINRLDFKSGNISLEVEDHPTHIDIIKVLLPAPLTPGNEITITTPFHVKLPYNFSRGGHNGIGGQSYQLTQWYPKPAVYDAVGWHPMPYLDQGGFYSEFGSFDVKITLPGNYVVAATGQLQNEEEIAWLKTRSVAPQRKKIKSPAQKNSFRKTVTRLEEIPSDSEMKTLHFRQDNIHDFAIFADKYFIVNRTTIRLNSGREIAAWSFYHENSDSSWKKSLEYTRDAITFRSAEIGDYPYAVVTVVEAGLGGAGGMEYPMLAHINPGTGSKHLERLIHHEVGHNWFYGILAGNERKDAWLDEGLSTYYDNRYLRDSNTNIKTVEHALLNKNYQHALQHKEEVQKKDQPIATAADEFSVMSYRLVPHEKAATLFLQIEKEMGRLQFDEAIKEYFQSWKFRHPSPSDLTRVLQKHSNSDLTHLVNLIYTKGSFPGNVSRRRIKPGFIYTTKPQDSIYRVDLLPVPAYNTSDGFMIGAAVHNYSLPYNRFRYLIAPLYATRSKQLNGVGDLAYSLFPAGALSEIRAGFGFARFSTLSGIDSNNNRVSAGFVKWVPSLKAVLRNKDNRSTEKKWIEFKTYIIGESAFEYHQNSVTGYFNPSVSGVRYRYINQFSFAITDQRALYPYDAELQLQQARDFYRVNLSANYLFNYAGGGGMKIRLFAAKFGYVGQRSPSKHFATLNYQPKLTAVRGDEDYTYSNYFAGRNETDGVTAQQIMIRDGGLKIRTDIFQDLQGRSDDWVASINFSTSIPKQILPPQIPLRLFFDIGTYAEPWKRDAEGSRFMYVAGLQLSLFRELLNIYAPVVYSKEFGDNLKTVPEENKFFRKISFSVDIHRFRFRKSAEYKILN